MTRPVNDQDAAFLLMAERNELKQKCNKLNKELEQVLSKCEALGVLNSLTGHDGEDITEQMEDSALHHGLERDITHKFTRGQILQALFYHCQNRDEWQKQAGSLAKENAELHKINPDVIDLKKENKILRDGLEKIKGSLTLSEKHCANHNRCTCERKALHSARTTLAEADKVRTEK